jgi:hypothetical protein
MTRATIAGGIWCGQLAGFELLSAKAVVWHSMEPQLVATITSASCWT